MAITRLGTYSQIKGSSYKLPCKVATSSSVSLTGGAPLVVDGYTLATNDRVLVISQNTATQNGIYIVQSTGSGANGTWVRAIDFSLDDDIFQGTQVFIISGSNAGKSYYISTPDPISLNSTSLSFLPNVSGLSLIESTSYTIPGTYTWNKPNNAKIISVIAVGGGGGGASGGAATGTGIAGGAGGGGGGAVVIATLPAVVLAATESVTVGAGGAGGVGSTRVGAGTNVATNGSSGSIGGASIFGEIIAGGGGSGSYTIVNNIVGFGGAPAPLELPTITANNTTGYTISNNQIMPIALSGPGGSGAAIDRSPASVAALTMSFFVPTGGGFGGNPGSTTTLEDGGSGGFSATSFGNISGGVGGTDGVDGGNGNLVAPFFGTGGGGGYGSYVVTGTAQGTNGGTGSIGAGGGGGGTGRVNTSANPNTAIGGNGGKGGDGIILVYVYG